MLLPVKVSIALGSQYSDEVRRYGANTMMPDKGRRGAGDDDGPRYARLRTSSDLKTKVLLLRSKVFRIINSLQLRGGAKSLPTQFCCGLRDAPRGTLYDVLLPGESEHHSQ
jgi:hypothetical protein